MKKIKNILLSIAMLFVVVLATACSDKEATSTKTFVLDKNGIKTTITYTYIEKEDKILKQNTQNVGVYAQLPKANSKEAAQKLLDPVAKNYQGIKGIKQSIDYQDDKFVEDLEIDYTDLDFEQAKKLFGPNFQDPTKVKVSLKKTEEGLLKQGYTEQK